MGKRSSELPVLWFEERSTPQQTADLVRVAWIVVAVVLSGAAVVALLLAA